MSETKIADNPEVIYSSSSKNLETKNTNVDCKKIAEKASLRNPSSTTNEAERNLSSPDTEASDEPNNVSETSLIDEKDLYKSNNSPISSNNPLFRIFAALLVTGSLAVAVIFLWSFWNKITGGSSEQNKATEETEEEASEEEAATEEPSEEDRLRAQLAFIEQDRAVASEPTPTPETTTETVSEPTPEPAPQPIARTSQRPVPNRQSTPVPKTVETNPLDDWAILANLGATDQNNSSTALSKLAQPEDREESSVASLGQSQSKIYPDRESRPVPTDRSRSAYSSDASSQSEEVARIASLNIGPGQLTSASQSKSQRYSQSLTPASRKAILTGYNRQISSLANSGTTSSQLSSSNSTLSNSQKPINKNTEFSSGIKTIPLGTSVNGNVATNIVWSENTASERTRATLTLTEPLKNQQGEIALPTGSNLIVEVAQIDSNGMTLLDAIAVSYIDKQGQFQQQAITPGTLLVRGENHQPLIAESIGDSGNTLLGQDILIGVLGAGDRGFEVLNEPTEETIITDDGFYGSSFRSSTRRDRSLVNGALEGAFGTTKDRLEARSDRLVEAEIARSRIYQIEAGTPVSIYVNSFLQINN